MGIREQLNERPRLTTGITLAIIFIVFGYFIWANRGVGGTGGTSGRVFFSDDDGQTWFADDAGKLPPFERSGKQAVRAVVYRCDGKTFVNHLERFTPEVKKKLEAARGSSAQATPDDFIALDVVGAAGLEVKSPGQKDWVKASDPRAVEVMKPKCKGDDFEVVLP